MALGSENPSVRVRIRWWLVVLFVGSGFVFIAVADWLSGQDASSGSGPQFWASVLVNVGSTLLLAALLVWFERRLVARVERSNARVAEAAVRAAETTAREAVASVERRLDALEELDRAFASEAGQVKQEQEANLERVSSDVTFESTRDALLQTRALGGIPQMTSWDQTCSVTVAGGQQPAPARVTVTFHGDTINDSECITFESSGKTGIASAAWRTEDQLVDVLKAFRSSLVFNGLPAQAHSLRPAILFSNLQYALRVATERREGRSADWRDAEAVIELISKDLLVSDAGLEVRSLGLVKRRSDFLRFTQDGVGHEAIDPVCPDLINKDDWEYALNSAHSRFDEIKPQPDIWNSTPF